MATGDLQNAIDVYGDGSAILYQITKNKRLNPIWQAIIKVPSSKGRVRKSTNCRNEGDAKRWVHQERLKIEARAQEGLPINPVRFERVAYEYLAWLEAENANGQISDKNLSDKTRLIEKSLIPYFQGRYIHSIQTKDIEAYHRQRTTKGLYQGRKVARGTINRDNGTLRGIFEHAIREKHISVVPLIKNVSAKVKRGSFSRGEAKLIQDKLVEYVQSGENDITPHTHPYRKLFSAYIHCLQYSGIRTGSEMASLKWADIKYVKSEGNEYVLLRCKSSKQKDGVLRYRTVAAQPQLKAHLEALKEDERLYDKDGYVFAHPTNTPYKGFAKTPIKSFRKQFEKFLAYCGIPKEKDGRQRTLYSQRHYYAEQRIITGDVDLTALAINMGSNPSTIFEWYQEATAQQLGGKITRLIKKENS